MATQTEQIMASQLRQRIPTEWLVDFQTWSDAALLSLAEDERADRDVRAYATWELDYRIAYDRPGPADDAPGVRGAKGEKPVDRSRWTQAGAEATIRRLMEEEDR